MIQECARNLVVRNFTSVVPIPRRFPNATPSRGRHQQMPQSGFWLILRLKVMKRINANEILIVSIACQNFQGINVKQVNNVVYKAAVVECFVLACFSATAAEKNSFEHSWNQSTCPLIVLAFCSLVFVMHCRVGAIAIGFLCTPALE